MKLPNFINRWICSIRGHRLKLHDHGCRILDPGRKAECLRCGTTYWWVKGMMQRWDADVESLFARTMEMEAALVRQQETVDRLKNAANPFSTPKHPIGN